jgi:acetyltransferase-like isoleucine patch superfamily enzyme
MILELLERMLTSRLLKGLKDKGVEISFGRGVRIEHPECVRIGNGVRIGDYCWISIVVENREVGQPAVKLAPELTIEDGAYIGRFATLACIDRVRIGRDVMISDRAFIGDAFHGFSRTDLPIRDQYMTTRGPVEIGDGSWLGIGVSVLSNVKIGRHCVIGAGSVVTKDIPDYSIAAGVPARVMKTRPPQ